MPHVAGKGVSHLVYAGAHKQSGADEALEAYRAAQELAVQHLATTHPIHGMVRIIGLFPTEVGDFYLGNMATKEADDDVITKDLV